MFVVINVMLSYILLSINRWMTSDLYRLYKQWVVSALSCHVARKTLADGTTISQNANQM